MTTIYDIYNAIDNFAPFKYAEGWDNCGILIGDKSAEVKNVLLCLDVTNDIIDEATAKNVDLIITHHPVIFHALKNINANTNVHKLIRNNIGVISAHTNLDIANGFVNNVLAQKLGLQNIEHLEITSSVAETVSLGKIGKLQDDTDIEVFARNVKLALGCDKVEFTTTKSKIKNVAVCGGSGGSLIETAIEKDADVLVTGDVKHNEFLLAHELGISVIDAGHFHTEEPVLDLVQKTLEDLFADINFCKTKNLHIVHTI